MSERLSVVLDIGKTNAKLSLWSSQGRLVCSDTRANARRRGAHYPTLDVEGVEAWLAETLGRFGEIGAVGAIIPVGHGAAAAIVRDGALAAPVMDYEFDPPPAARAEYGKERDPFEQTGSPAMGMALNLGLQLHCIEQLHPDALRGGAQILPWPQYWAWRLSGVATSEVTSWGSHTDLWSPARNAPSNMAVRRGWARLFAPRRHAGEIIGRLTDEWVARTGLKSDVAVHTGLHDSNAALCWARAHPEFAHGDATLISTGTWFVSMRSLAEAAQAPPIPENRGCLLNVDVEGRPAPTMLFMGGRELELLGASGLDAPDRQGALLAAMERVVEVQVMVRPTLAAGTGIFPDRAGGWAAQPEGPVQCDAAAALYAALMIDAGLDLIGGEGTALLEGRYAQCQPFARALAALRPQSRVYVSGAESDLAAGALRFVMANARAPAPLIPVAPLPLDLAAFRAAWRDLVAAG
ncbi:MAG: hypothetical protein JNJ73_11390 [Hyphomonadaceae bacterium]|nr:hypothetical protein [Hyphomonadaceae bacterium]